MTTTVYFADIGGFDARALRELQAVISFNKQLIERQRNKHLA